MTHSEALAVKLAIQASDNFTTLKISLLEADAWTITYNHHESQRTTQSSNYREAIYDIVHYDNADDTNCCTMEPHA